MWCPLCTICHDSKYALFSPVTTHNRSNSILTKKLFDLIVETLTCCLLGAFHRTWKNSAELDIKEAYKQCSHRLTSFRISKVMTLSLLIGSSFKNDLTSCQICIFLDMVEYLQGEKSYFTFSPVVVQHKCVSPV